MSEEKILKPNDNGDPNLMPISKNQEFINSAELLFGELKSYLAIEDRDLKKIWDMKDWPSAMAGLYQYIKAGMTDPTSIMRRGTLIQMLAYTVVCYSTLDQDPKSIKEAQAKITQKAASIEEEDKYTQEAAKQSLKEALLGEK